MRELKFRGRATLDGKWEYGSNVTRLAEHDLHSFFHAAAMGEIDESTIEQYAGIQDGQGHDIYEGDIVQADKTHVREFRRIVSFRDGQFGFEGKYDASDFYPLAGRGSEGKWFVIGNIHENPGLLEVKL